MIPTRLRRLAAIAVGLIASVAVIGSTVAAGGNVRLTNDMAAAT